MSLTETVNVRSLKLLPTLPEKFLHDCIGQTSVEVREIIVNFPNTKLARKSEKDNGGGGEAEEGLITKPNLQYGVLPLPSRTSTVDREER